MTREPNSPATLTESSQRVRDLIRHVRFCRHFAHAVIAAPIVNELLAQARARRRDPATPHATAA